MMEQTKLERIISGVVLLALLVGCLLVLRPFVSALLWAAVLCFSTWPFYKRLLSLVRGRRTLAAMLMTLGMILIILLPFVIVGGTRADNVKEFISAARTYVDAGPPAPPAWLAKIPAVGQASYGTLASSRDGQRPAPGGGKTLHPISRRSPREQVDAQECAESDERS